MDLHLTDVSVRLPGMNRVLFAIRRLDVAEGERVLIQGPSGKGKTTLLHLMAGLLQPVSGGLVQLAEHNLASLSEVELAQLRRDKIGFIFQKLNLISHLTAQENVRLGLDSQSDERVLAALKILGLETSANVLAHNLSLGQQQRVAVARVLAKKPQLVLADEPTSSLDDENAEGVMKALFKLPSQTTMVVVSHDHRLRDRFTRVIDFDQVTSV